jgi:hypothetical protein
MNPATAFAVFLPPARRIEDGVPEDDLRAVVSRHDEKETAGFGQEYESPLLVLTAMNTPR